MNETNDQHREDEVREPQDSELRDESTATEDQGVGALQDLDALDIVKIAVVLDVVAHPVEEEVGGGLLPANEHLVAVAFAGFHADTGDKAQGIVQRGDALVFQLV